MNKLTQMIHDNMDDQEDNEDSKSKSEMHS